MLTLDGSRGEGGGQMLRTALVLSLITGIPFRMENIRAGRKDPGLKAQHVTILKALRLFGPVSFKGAAVGSSVVEFHPAELRGVEATIDIGTAGSITLLLQTLIPVALRAGGSSLLTLIGGTDVAWSPTLDYLREVLLPRIRERSKTLRIAEGSRRGFFPRGGGEVILEAEGWKRQGVPVRATERGGLTALRVLSVAAESLADRKVAERQAAAAREELGRLGRDCRTEVRYSRTLSPGSAVTCIAQFEGGITLGRCGLGERGKPAEAVGREAGQGLRREIESGACVDSFAADQLILWLAMSGGEIRPSELTQHTMTNLEVAQAFTGAVFEVDGLMVRCRAQI